MAKRLHNVIIPIKYPERISARDSSKGVEYVCLQCGIRYCYYGDVFYVYTSRTPSTDSFQSHWILKPNLPDCNEYSMDQALR